MPLRFHEPERLFLFGPDGCTRLRPVLYRGDMLKRLSALLLFFAGATYAQLSTEQRVADFRNLTDLYSRRYAAIEWKQSALNFNLLDLSPWVSRVAEAKDDLEFYDLMVEYVSDLWDAHDQYYLPSDFEAHLGFSVDVYDGKLLIDGIDRNLLNADSYPFQVGDRIVSIDHQPAEDLVKQFTKYVAGGNPRTVERLAAGFLTNRYQTAYPRAHEIGDRALVFVERQNGAIEYYTISWHKSGTPLTVLGPSQSPQVKRSGASARSAESPKYRQMLEQIRNFALPGKINVLGFDALKPVFQMPSGFEQRLGTKSYDSFFTGRYLAADGTRVGYLRIPDFMYPYMPDLDREIGFFEAATDVLVVDVMRNPGGDVCSAEEVISRLAPRSFQGAAAEMRVSWSDIVSVNESLADAAAYGDDAAVAQLQLYQREFQSAFLNNQGRTKALPLCAANTDRMAVETAYTKPVLVLTDEMSASSADIFAAMVQDNRVAPLFGYRTMGAGGSPQDVLVGVYSEGETSVTRSLVVRLHPVVTPDYPTTSYVENVGVRPDVPMDYMTKDDLLNGGASFVKAFTDAAVKLTKGN